MTSYRNSKLIERYEDVVFELDTALNTNLTVDQIKDGHRFVVDSTGETTPLDWYNARFNVDFKVVLRADGGNIAVNDHNGIVNSSHSLIRKLNVKMGGINVYDCSDANHATNIKNMLEYSQGYVKSQGSNEFFFLDTNRHAEEVNFDPNVNINVRNEGNTGAQALAFTGPKMQIITQVLLQEKHY